MTVIFAIIIIILLMFLWYRRCGRKTTMKTMKPAPSAGGPAKPAKSHAKSDAKFKSIAAGEVSSSLTTDDLGLPEPALANSILATMGDDRSFYQLTDGEKLNFLVD